MTISDQVGYVRNTDTAGLGASLQAETDREAEFVDERAFFIVDRARLSKG